MNVIKQANQVTTAPILLFNVTGVSLDLFLLVTGGFSQVATKIELGLGSRWPFYSDSIQLVTSLQHLCTCLGSTPEEPDSSEQREGSSICNLKSLLHALIQPQQRAAATDSGLAECQAGSQQGAVERRQKTTRLHMCRALQSNRLQDLT